MVEAYRVLIIDDEWVSARILEKLLGVRGCSTKAVTNSSEAISQLRDFKPHAVTVDGNMPGMDGCEVVRQIRSEPGFENIPIVSVSAFADDAHKAQSIAAGATHYVPKPANIETLCRALAVPARAQLTPQERAAIQGQVASVNAKLNAPGLSGDEWCKLHDERHALEQKLLADKPQQ
jgi:CheY-like chemotaxis protein